MKTSLLLLSVLLSAQEIEVIPLTLAESKQLMELSAAKEQAYKAYQEAERALNAAFTKVHVTHGTTAGPKDCVCNGWCVSATVPCWSWHLDKSFKFLVKQ